MKSERGRGRRGGVGGRGWRDKTLVMDHKLPFFFFYGMIRFDAGVKPCRTDGSEQTACVPDDTAKGDKREKRSEKMKESLTETISLRWLGGCSAAGTSNSDA